MMKYMDFEKTMVDAVQNRLGEDYCVTVQAVTKNNGTLLKGMVITGRDKNISPTIYLEPFFEQYQGGAMDLDKILEELCRLYESSKDNILGNIDDLKQFERLKDKIAYKLIGRNKNEGLLKDVPYTSYLDMVVVYYLLLDSNENGQMTALIHNEHLKLWDVKQEEIHKLATENTKRLLPVCIRPIMDIMLDMMVKDMGDFEDAEKVSEYLDADEKEKGHPLFVLSNTSGMNGAACILYDGIIEKFARECQQDVVILPSSIHELLLLSWTEEMDYEDLQQMVQSVNGTMLSEEDILSEHVYIYRREDGAVKIAI